MFHFMLDGTQYVLGDSFGILKKVPSIGDPPVESIAASITPASGYIGSIFEIDPGTYTGDPIPVISYTLTSNGFNVTTEVVDGAYISTDDGPLVLTGTVTNIAGSISITTASATVLPNPENTVAPTITGSGTEIGATVTLDFGVWTGSPPLTGRIEQSANGTTGWSTYETVTTGVWAVPLALVGSYYRLRTVAPAGDPAFSTVIGPVATSAGIVEIVGYLEGEQTTSVLSHSIPLPMGEVGDRLLVALFHAAASNTWTVNTAISGTGWTVTTDANGSGGDSVRMYLCTKIAEGSDALTFTAPTVDRSIRRAYRFAPSEGSFEIVTGNSNGSTAVPTLSLDMTVPDEYLWMAIIGIGGANTLTVPTSFTDLVTTQHTITSMTVGTAFRTFETGELTGVQWGVSPNARKAVALIGFGPAGGAEVASIFNLTVEDD